MTRTVVFALLLFPTLATAAVPLKAITRKSEPLVGAHVPPNPHNPDPFYAGEDLSEYVVVDELQYPVPYGIDRSPGLKQEPVEAYSAVDPAEE